MTRYQILLYHADMPDFLSDLQDAGVVHLVARDMRQDDEIDRRMDRIKHCQSIVNLLKAIRIENDTPSFSGDAEEIVAEADKLAERIATLDAKLPSIEKDIENNRLWGDFDADNLTKIADSGYIPRFYIASEHAFKPEIGEKYPLWEVNRHKGKVYYILLQDKNEEFNHEANELKIAPRPVKNLLAELRSVTEDLNNTRKTLESMAKSVDKVEAKQKKLTDEASYKIALLSAESEADGSLKLLTGWVPDDKNDELKAFLDSKSVYYIADDKPDNDPPPILLRNNRFAKLFEPITKLYSLPEYSEIDPTPLFAPFFMMFFGFCLGDGGYGLLLVAVCSLLKSKIKNQEIRPYLSLMQWLGSAAVIFGLITGGFFGVSIYKGVDKIAEARFGLNENYGMMILAFILGFIQIIFGMCVKVANIVAAKGWKYAVSDIAWIVFILTAAAYFAADKSGNKELAIFLLPILGIAALFMFFYNLPGKNPLINFGNGIWITYGTLSGLLGDMLSYIRLFALGMTGSILGMVFNSLAVDAKNGIGTPVASHLVMLLILVFGHGLNLALNTLGALVHPLRLTFVEFYKNTGFTGGGTGYNPLRRLSTK